MKKIVIVLLCFISVGALAQQRMGGGAKQQQIQTAKIGLITEKINLTPEQAPQFWAVYNEFERKRIDIQRNIKQAIDESNSLTTPDDKLMASHRQILGNRRKLVDLEEEYMGKFLKVISIRQYAELQKAENNFKKLLIERVNRGNGKPNDDN